MGDGNQIWDGSSYGDQDERDFWSELEESIPTEQPNDREESNAERE